MFDQDWGPTSESADRWIDEWAANAAAQAERAKELSQRVADLSITASSDDGLIEVTVAGSGLLTDVWLADRVTSRHAASIAAEILRVMHKAQAELATQVGGVVADTVGADSPAGQAVIEGFARRFPAQPEDNDSDRQRGYGRR